MYRAGINMNVIDINKIKFKKLSTQKKLDYVYNLAAGWTLIDIFKCCWYN